METPQEIEVWYVLPAIRKELTISMKEKGMTQRAISKTLGVTEPAISQYLKNKRAKNINFPDNIKEEIETVAERLVNKRTCCRAEYQRILLKLKKTKELCKIHRQFYSVSEFCNICSMKNESISR